METVVFRIISSYLVSSLIVNISSSQPREGPSEGVWKETPIFSLFEILQHNLEIRDAIDTKMGKILLESNLLHIILAK